MGNVAATLVILRTTDLHDEGQSHDSAVQIALALHAGYNLAATIASLYCGRVGDRRGMLAVLTAGAAAFLLAYAALALAGPDIVFLAIAFAPAGIGIRLRRDRRARCRRPASP
ncbi:hypothetical protein BH09ACT13_BH09ACT13_07250 [soil metagenome]